MSPFLFFSFFAQKRSLFHHDFLFLAGSGSGSGACLPSCLFFAHQKRRLFHHDFLFLAGSGSGSGSGSGASLPFLSPFLSFLSLLKKGSCFQYDFLVLPCFRLWFRGLSPFLSPFLFFFLSLLKKGACSIMISCFLLVPAPVPGLVSLLVSLLVVFFFLCSKKELFQWFPDSCWFRLWFRRLSPFLSFLSLLKKGGCSSMIFWFFLVPALGACLPSCLPSCFYSFFAQKRRLFHHDFLVSCWFRLRFRCLSPFFSLLSFPGKGFCSIMMCWFLLVPARVPVLVSPSSLFFLSRKGVLFHHDVLVLFGFCSGSGASPNSSRAEWGFQFLQETVFVPS